MHKQVKQDEMNVEIIV